ncbi:MAG: shikimate kinase [Endomicrobium sp.]|jgi:shikimate kinase|nr:shikimate kinase [Endomicrobium sp.]
MNLVVTGFMGTGKSKTGKILSEKLKMNFFDTDSLIEKKLGLSISDIFKKFGEFYFRQIETGIIKEVSEKDFVIISCGGGAVLNIANITVLRKKGIIINLYASAEIIYERLKSENNRPLLKCKDPLSEIKKLLTVRKDAYKNYDISFNTDGLTASEVADKILSENSIRKIL